MKKIFIIPKTGLIVKDPYTKKAIPERGIEVTKNVYWQRRLLEGDVSLEKKKEVKKNKPVKQEI